ncbi:MAG: hypothetical protein ABSF59_22480 [Candidatus Sulfotelmatobacter sp.]|jgi:hypothetical protein
MSEETPVSPQPAPPANSPPAAQHGPTIRIGDEFGTAKRNLPPVKILLFALAGVLFVVGVFSFLQRPKPQGAGSLDNVAAVQIPGQTAVLTALTFTLRNSGEKPLWVHGIQGQLTSTSGELTAQAVSAVDFDRYYQGFPALKPNSQPALAPEDQLQPGREVKRTVIVSFPVTLDAFNQRKSVSVDIQPYDQPLPIILTK